MGREFYKRKLFVLENDGLENYPVGTLVGLGRLANIFSFTK